MDGELFRKNILLVFEKYIEIPSLLHSFFGGREGSLLPLYLHTEDVIFCVQHLCGVCSVYAACSP